MQLQTIYILKGVEVCFGSEHTAYSTHKAGWVFAKWKNPQVPLHNISCSFDGTAQYHAEDHAKDLLMRKPNSIDETLHNAHKS